MDSLRPWAEVRSGPSGVAILAQNLRPPVVLEVFRCFGGGAGLRACVCVLTPVPRVSDATVVISCVFPARTTTCTGQAGRQVRMRSTSQDNAVLNRTRIYHF